MADALWELAPPIFLGTFLAIVAVIFLANKQRKLLRGPARLANWLFGAPCRRRGDRGGCGPGCGCGACRAGRGGGRRREMSGGGCMMGMGPSTGRGGDGRRHHGK